MKASAKSRPKRKVTLKHEKARRLDANQFGDDSVPLPLRSEFLKALAEYAEVEPYRGGK